MPVPMSSSSRGDVMEAEDQLVGNTGPIQTVDKSSGEPASVLGGPGLVGAKGAR